MVQWRSHLSVERGISVRMIVNQKTLLLKEPVSIVGSGEWLDLSFNP
jgi:hypothetical protein